MSNFRVYTPYDFGGVGDGHSDDSTAVQKWLDATAGGAPGLAVLPPATWLTGPVQMHGQSKIMGMGKKSVLKAKTGSSGPFVGLTTDPAAQGVVASDFAVDGNGQNVTGIYLDNASLRMDPNDSLHRVERIWSSNAGVDGFALGPAVIETVLASCWAFNAGRYGFHTEVGATDNKLIGCSSGASRSDGYHLVGNNTLVSACKSYYSGYNRSTIKWAPAHGFALQPDMNQQLRMVSLVGCEAQNNAIDGFHIDGGAVQNSTVQHVTMSSCMADGNNEMLAGGVGVYLRKALNCMVNGTVTNLQTPAAQDYGLALYGDLSGTQIGINDWSGGSVAPVYRDKTAQNYQVVAMADGAAPAVPAGTALASGQMGLDAPFDHVMRVVNSDSEGIVQVLAGNAVQIWIGGKQVASIDAKGVHTP